MGTKPRTLHNRLPGGERCVKRKHRQSLKEQERAIISQTNTGTISKALLRKLLRNGVEHIIMGFSEHIDTILN